MKKKHKRLVSLLASLAIFALGLYLVLSQFKENIVFFYTPSELHSKEVTLNSEVRIGGLVKENSISVDKQDQSIHNFIITDGGYEVNVTYKGILPDLFREKQGIVAKGKLADKFSLEASEILTKHDEKYMPKELNDKLKEQGYYKESK